MQGRADWEGSDRVLELAVSVVEDLRRHAASLNLSIEGDNSGWLWQNWPHVEFAFCSGFRMQVAVKSQGRKFKVRDGSELKLTQKSLVSEEHASAVFYVSRHGNHFFTGLHVPSGFCLLAFGGCRVEIRGNSVVFDDLLEMLCVSPVSYDLLHLRATLASKMCSFLQGCPNHANHAQTLKALLCCNSASPVTCLLYRPVVSVAPTVPASSDFAEANQVARARCSEELCPVSACPPCIQGSHTPKKRKGRVLYELLTAAQDGCLTCVRRELELLTRVAPETFSDSHRWTVRDFAKDAAKGGRPGAREIQSYLDLYWPHVPVEP